MGDHTHRAPRYLRVPRQERCGWIILAIGVVFPSAFLAGVTVFEEVGGAILFVVDSGIDFLLPFLLGLPAILLGAVGAGRSVVAKAVLVIGGLVCMPIVFASTMVYLIIAFGFTAT